jgi:tetratricopeptide (TPR) repeat protein
VSDRIAATLLVLCVGLAYANSLDNGFVWDDAVLIAGRSAFYGDARNIPAALVSPDGASASPVSYYRPVAALDYFVDQHLFGGVPFAYHLESVLLHLLVTLLFWRLVASSFRSPGLALIAALLFAVHPVNSEAVNFLSARNNLLCAGFLLAALNLLQAERLRGPRAVLALASYALALLCKEPAIVLPVFVLFWWWPDLTRGARAVTLAGLFGVAGAYLLSRLAVLGTVATGAEFGGLGLVSAALYEDLRLLFLPLELNALHVVSPAALVSTPTAVTALALVALLAAALFAAPPLRWGSAWILLGLAPVANLVPFPSAPVAERYLYIPALGSALVVGYGLYWLSTRFRAVGIAAGAVLVGLMFSQTALRNRAWQSDETLAQSMLAANPRNATARVLLGSAYREGGRYGEALDQFRKALDVQPANARVYANMGNVYLETGEFENALEAYETALRLDPGRALTHFYSGVAAEASGDTTRAAAHYEGFLAATKGLEEPAYRPLRRRARQRLHVLRRQAPGGDG